MADAGVTLTFRSQGQQDVERRLAQVLGAIKTPRQLMNTIGAVLESSTRRRFRTGVGPDGVAWKPSARVAAKGGKTLFWHGHLSGSITHDADDHSAKVGSNLIYARIHQLGGVIEAKNGGRLRFQIPGVGWRSVAKVTIPARPYLGVDDRDRVEIADQTRRYIERMAA